MFEPLSLEQIAWLDRFGLSETEAKMLIEMFKKGVMRDALYRMSFLYMLKDKGFVNVSVFEQKQCGCFNTYSCLSVKGALVAEFLSKR